MIKTTLRFRIILLMVVFSVLFIGVFAAIQLKSQLDSMNRFNFHNAKLGTLITQNALETAFSVIQNQNDSEQIKKVFLTVSDPFVQSGLLEQISLLNQEGEVLASLGRNEIQSSEVQNRFYINQLKSEESKKTFFTFLDKVKRQIHIIIPLPPHRSYFAALDYHLENLQAAFRQVYLPLSITFVVVAIANLVFGVLLSRAIIVPIRNLNIVTKKVAGGNLDLRVQINTGDEFEELGNTFNEMTAELKQMTLRAENANPLTKLPGNLVIREEVEKRIQSGEKFLVIYGDLNNFKAFNDYCGIAEGDKVIQMVADVMRTAVKERGNPGDLLGHEGGDDFIIVTTPDRADGIATRVLESFNEKIKMFYSEEDQKQGFFVACGRDGTEHRYPIMGIALAGVTNQFREFKNYAEVTHVCAEVKRNAKTFIRSGWWIDRRRSSESKD